MREKRSRLRFHQSRRRRRGCLIWRVSQGGVGDFAQQEDGAGLFLHHREEEGPVERHLEGPVRLLRLVLGRRAFLRHLQRHFVDRLQDDNATACQHSAWKDYRGHEAFSRRFELRYARGRLSPSAYLVNGEPVGVGQLAELGLRAQQFVLHFRVHVAQQLAQVVGTRQRELWQRQLQQPASEHDDQYRAELFFISFSVIELTGLRFHLIHLIDRLNIDRKK